jgi:outer membrane protein TolC
VSAERILADAARADLKRRFDLQVSGGMSTLYESPLFRYLPDELDDPPKEAAVQYYSPTGYWRSLDEEWKPFVRLTLSLEFPFKNNSAAGRMAQTQASLAQREIESRDLDRTIRDNIVELTGALQAARASVERIRLAVERSEDALRFTGDLFRAGEVPLIDLLTTEEDVTNQSLDLVRKKRVHADLMARLRFETGSLVDFSSDESILEPTGIDATHLVVSR